MNKRQRELSQKERRRNMTKGRGGREEARPVERKRKEE